MVAVTVDVLVQKLQPVRKKWYLIGSQLKLPNRQLNLIVNKHKNATDLCLVNLCKEWVSTSKEVTWPRVVDALKSELVDEKELACDIEREFCWVESNNSKTWVSVNIHWRQCIWRQCMVAKHDFLYIFCFL